MRKAAKEPDHQSAIDYQDFKVWLRDTQIRACFGTSEKDRIRCSRSDISSTGTKLRVIAILNTLRDAEIPLNIGAMTYNARCQRSEAFHIKYVIPPDVYISKFCTKYQLNLSHATNPQLRQTLQERFRKDYYGDDLRVVQMHKDSRSAVVIPTSGGTLVCAPDNELLNTGPVVLFNRPPLACVDLTDEVISEFEKAVITTFRDALQDVWYSVCFYQTNDVPSPDNAMICIGAKIDETKFIQTIQPPKEIQEIFLRKYKYETPKRKYH